MRLVTIVMCTYNTEAYLAEAIKSCLNQTYSNLELLIIDDGSTDSSKKIIDHFMKQDKRIRYIYKENTGLSDSKRVGLAEARGEIICHADSDDIQLPTKLELLVACLEAGDADFCYSGYYHGNMRGEPWEYIKPQEFTFENVTACTVFGSCAIAYWKKTCDKLSYRSDIRINEDLAWQLDALRMKFHYGMVDEPTYIYRMLPTGINISKKKELDLITAQLIKEYHEKA